MNYSSRIYNDGANFIANAARTTVGMLERKKKEKSAMDFFFDEVYRVAYIKFAITPEYMKEYILYCMTEQFGEWEGMACYVDAKMITKDKSRYQRKMRFWRKAYLNDFNYFYTQTYDSSIYASEDEFRTDLKKALSNMHTRRGWRYAGVWEEGGKNGRLHIHMLLYVPENQMPGICEVKRDYSWKRHRMEERNENSFFAARFGRNDFKPLDTQGRGKKPVQYVSKYMEKSSEKTLYSYGLPTYLGTEITDEEVAADMQAYKKTDAGIIPAGFFRYVTFPFIAYNPVFRWFRPDGLQILPRCG